MLKKIKEELNLGSYEISQLEVFNEKVLQEAYKVLKLRPAVTNPFKFLLGCCKKINERTAHVAPEKKEPVAEPDWVKDYKASEADDRPLEELHKDAESLYRKIKSYKAAIEQAKKNYANNDQSNAGDLRYIEQYEKDLKRAQRRYEILNNKINIQTEPINEVIQKTETVIDIANGIRAFMDEDRLNALSKIISLDVAIQMRDKAMANWLKRHFIYDPDEKNHQLALTVVNKYRQQYNLPAKAFQISNTADENKKDDTLINESNPFENLGENG